MPLWVTIVSNLGFDVHCRYQLAIVAAKLFEINQAVETKNVQNNRGFKHQRIYFAIQWNSKYLDLFTEGKRRQGKGGGDKIPINFNFVLHSLRRQDLKTYKLKIVLLFALSIHTEHGLPSTKPLISV